MCALRFSLDNEGLIYFILQLMLCSSIGINYEDLLLSRVKSKSNIYSVLVVNVLDYARGHWLFILGLSHTLGDLWRRRSCQDDGFLSSPFLNFGSFKQFNSGKIRLCLTNRTRWNYGKEVCKNLHARCLSFLLP